MGWDRAGGREGSTGMHMGRGGEGGRRGSTGTHGGVGREEEGGEYRHTWGGMGREGGRRTGTHGMLHVHGCRRGIVRSICSSSAC